MSSNELERQWQRVVFWSQVGDWLTALALAGAVCFALAIVNHLERMPW